MRVADPKAPTKEKILSSAVKLMLAQGYTATSVDEIIKDAKTTKGSFFYFFESKEALAKAALERFTACQQERFQSAPFNKEINPKKKVFGRIDAVISAFEDPSMPKSCLLGNFAQELASIHQEFQSICNKTFTLIIQDFACDLKAAGCREAESLAGLFHSIIQGSLILGKAKQEIKVAVDNMKHFKQYVSSKIKD